MEFSRLEYCMGSLSHVCVSECVCVSESLCVRLSLLQGIFLTQGSNPGLPRYSRILYQLSHQGSLE